MMEKLLKILKTINDDYDFLEESDFIQNGALDSLGIVSLVAGLETEFSISIDYTDIVPENFINIAAISGLIKRRGGEI